MVVTSHFSVNYNNSPLRVMDYGKKLWTRKYFDRYDFSVIRSYDRNTEKNSFITQAPGYGKNVLVWHGNIKIVLLKFHICSHRLCSSLPQLLEITFHTTTGLMPSNIKIQKISVFWPKLFIRYRGNIIDVKLKIYRIILQHYLNS